MLRDTGTSMVVDQDFSSVPVLDYALTRDSATRPEFLDQLRNALVNVGFLYLSNPPVSQDDIDLVIDYAPKLFTIPQEKKDKLLMRNNPHFLGYTKMGAEYTKGKADQREQYDFATPYECIWTPGAPDYLKLWGPAQVSARWPWVISPRPNWCHSSGTKRKTSLALRRLFCDSLHSVRNSATSSFIL